MIRRLIGVAPFLLVGAVLLGAASTGATQADRHISLVRSAPAKDTVLTQPPTEIRLWFSGVPRANATTIRVLDSAGAAVTAVMVMGVTPDPQDGKVQISMLHGALATGRYSVSWATVAGDGAEAEGVFAFTMRDW